LSIGLLIQDDRIIVSNSDQEVSINKNKDPFEVASIAIFDLLGNQKRYIDLTFLYKDNRKYFINFSSR